MQGVNFSLEAAPRFERGIEDLQSTALATWLCRHVGKYNNLS